MIELIKWIIVFGIFMLGVMLYFLAKPQHPMEDEHECNAHIYGNMVRNGSGDEKRN